MKVEVTPDLLEKARTVIAGLPEGQPWPQDDWFSLTDAVDLNLFSGPLPLAFGSRHASLYPVSAVGLTITDFNGTLIDNELGLNPAHNRRA